MEYTIQPVLMGGQIKELNEQWVKIHLHGRLGVITIKPCYISSEQPLVVGNYLSFYFSYLRITDNVFAMDLNGLMQTEPYPTMLYATVTEVNDTAIKAIVHQDIGTVAVPLRFVFTDVPLAVGQTVEFYLSHMIPDNRHR